MGEFLTALRPTFPDTEMLQSQVFHSSNLAIIDTSYLTLGDCACDQFCFMIPLRQTPVIRSGKKLYKLKEMSVFPCNPMQPHRVEDTGIVDFKALILYMEKTLLVNLAEDLFGRRSLELENNCFPFSPKLNELINTFISEYTAEQPGCSLMLDSLTVQAAILLLRECQHSLSSFSCQPGEYKDYKCIARAIEYITDNFLGKISLLDLASETHYSPYHFLRLFKQHTGKTPFEFLMDLKIEKAKALLKNSDQTISEVCYQSGFSSNSYFCQVFKKKTGVSPSQYKAET